MMNTVPRILAIAVTLALATGSAADESALSPGELEMVDAGVVDASPFAASFRSMQADFRVPTAFEHVYRVGGLENSFMRVQGGLYAIFPRSVYDQTERGLVPTIPNSTTFYIGRSSLDALIQQQASERQAKVMADTENNVLATDRTRRLTVLPMDTRPFRSIGTQALDLRVPDLRPGERPEDQERDRSLDRAVVEPPHPPVTDRGAERFTPPPIVDNPAYRRDRLRRLMRRASEAAQKRPSSGESK